MSDEKVCPLHGPQTELRSCSCAGTVVSLERAAATAVRVALRDGANGAHQYPPDHWRTVPAAEHIAHALAHVQGRWRFGQCLPPRRVDIEHAIARLAMALTLNAVSP